MHQTSIDDSAAESSLPEHELYVVEGRSAANAVGSVVDRSTQFVHPVQGKPMNVVRATAREVRANDRAQELYRRIVRNRAEGFDPDPAPGSRPFGRIILLADADVDGVHAKALLLVMIDQLFPDIVGDGMLHTVRAPQFGIDCHELETRVFAYSAEGRDNVLRQLAQRKATGVECNHYKGIASMNSDDIWSACISPDSRQITALTAEHVAAARAALA